MQIKTQFHKLLKDAVKDDTALVSVIDKIMPMINKLSRKNKKEIDEDLKSILITYSIEIIRKKEIFKIF
jgi:hypothetical protein